MIRSIFFLATAGFCSICPVFAHDIQTEITVQLYNAGHVTPTMLSKAEHEAAWIFGKAGINVHWESCRFQRESIGTQNCSEDSDPLLFVLWINPDHRSAPVSHEALGYALPFTGGAKHGAVSYRNVQETYEVNRDFVELYRLLANVMVHELIHLIFESNQHSTDLMRANWSRSDLQRMSQRRLIFTAEQVKRLHDSLNRRSRTALAPKNAFASLCFGERKTP